MNFALLMMAERPSRCSGPNIGRGCDRRKDHGLRPSVGRGCNHQKDHGGIEDTELLDIRDVVRESWVKIKLLVVS